MRCLTRTVCFAEEEHRSPSQEKGKGDADEQKDQDAAPRRSSRSSRSDDDSSSEDDSDDGVMHRMKSSVAHIRVSTALSCL